MSGKLPPLSWLRAFEASARHLSFTNAAQELALTQAAISKQIKLLEQYFGAPLFLRKPRSLALTKVGEAYVPKVRDAFERLAAGTDEVFGWRTDEPLTVRAAVGFSVNWLGSRLPSFLAQHPQKRVRLVSSVWNEPLDGESFDLDVRYGTGHWPGFQSRQLTSEALTPLCSPALLEGKVPLQTPADLDGHLLLHVLGYEEGWAVWLNAAGVRDVHPGQGLQFDNSLVAFEFAASGLGIALGRSSLIDRELSTGRLVAPFDLSVPINEAFYLVWSNSPGEHPDAAAFREWMVGEAGLEG